jgi:hypothetical protein
MIDTATQGLAIGIEMQKVNGSDTIRITGLAAI